MRNSFASVWDRTLSTWHGFTPLNGALQQSRLVGLFNRVKVQKGKVELEIAVIVLIILGVFSIIKEIKFTGLVLRIHREQKIEQDAGSWTFRNRIIGGRLGAGTFIALVAGLLLATNQLFESMAVVSANTLFWEVMWRHATKLDRIRNSRRS